MATKAFYKGKVKTFVVPFGDIRARAQRSLERNVPIGRGHPWRMYKDRENYEVPNWSKDPWTRNVLDALTKYPALPNRTNPLKDRKAGPLPLEKLVKSFLNKHPHVAWQVPMVTVADWPVTLFCRRQLTLMEDKNLSQEDAYMQVVKEGGGGGDWMGVWETLEHDRLKRLVRKVRLNPKSARGFQWDAKLPFQKAAGSSSERDQAQSKEDVLAKNSILKEGESLIETYSLMKQLDMLDITGSNKGNRAEQFLKQAENYYKAKEAAKQDKDIDVLKQILEKKGAKVL